MDAPILIGLLNNAAWLLALGVLYAMLPLRRIKSRWLDISTGLIIGAIGIAVMLNPWQLAPGVVFDTRSILLSTSGLFFGPIPAAVAVLMTALLRIYQGGAGALTGVMTIFTTAALGLLWGHVRRRTSGIYGWLELYVFGVVVHIAMLLCMLTLPAGLAFDVLRKITIPVMLIYPIGTVLLGRLLVHQSILRQSAQQVWDSEERFRNAFDHASSGRSLIGLDGHFIRVNQALCNMLGYRAEELLSKGFADVTHPDDLAISRECVRCLLAGEQPDYHMEKRYLRRDGTVVWASVGAVLSRDAKGTPNHFITDIQDISARKQAEEALRHETEMTQQYLDIVGAIIVIIEADQSVRLINQAGCRLLGYSQEEIVGQNWFDTFLPEHSRDTVKTAFAQLLRGDIQPIEFYENSVLTSDGEQRLVAWHNTALKDETGRVVAILSSGEDVTERREIEAALLRTNERLSALRDIDREIAGVHSTRPIAETVLKRIRTLISCQRADLLLIREDDGELYLYATDLAGQSAIPIGQPVMPEHAGRRQLVFAGQPFTIPDLRKLEEPVNAYARQLLREGIRSLLRVPLTVQGTVTGVLSLAADTPGYFTAEHQQIAEEIASQLAIAFHQAELREQIERHNKELGQQVEERTAQLMSANKELEAFTYSVSHDLRAPLRGMDGFSKALLEDYGDTLDETAQHYLQRVRAAAQRMGELIDDLLHLSRVTRTELICTRVDLSALATAIAHELSHAQPDRQVTFDIAPRLSAHADARLLHIVIDNLIRNAWKFTSQHATARIEIAGRQDGDATIYWVRDDGAGFDPVYADRLFGPFQRLHSNAEFEGSGIGLAIVQRIIQRHNGRVWAEGAEEQGATFFFTLPSTPHSDH